MRGCSSMLAARRLAVCLGAVAVFTLPAVSGAASPANRVAELRDRATSIDARAKAATLELYAIESQLGRVRAELADVRLQAAEAESQLRSLRIQLDAAWQSTYVAEHRLAERIRQLYQSRPADAVSVLLGASSVDEAITGLESLRSIAASDRDVVEQVRRARADLTAAKRRVAARSAALRRAEAAAEATALGLESARADRQALLSRLSSERGLTTARIERAQRDARRAERRSSRIAPATPTAAPVVEGPAALEPIGDRETMTVVATGYAIRGTTATGLSTAWGVVAVDPSVIPLGTRLLIPGYGEGIAADTGGAVRGAHIDLWFPSTAEALAWGRRTVTITIRG